MSTLDLVKARKATIDAEAAAELARNDAFERAQEELMAPLLAAFEEVKDLPSLPGSAFAAHKTLGARRQCSRTANKILDPAFAKRALLIDGSYIRGHRDRFHVWVGGGTQTGPQLYTCGSPGTGAIDITPQKAMNMFLTFCANEILLEDKQ